MCGSRPWGAAAFHLSLFILLLKLLNVRRFPPPSSRIYHLRYNHPFAEDGSGWSYCSSSTEECSGKSTPAEQAGSSGLPKSTPPAHSWNQVTDVVLESPLQVITRQAVISLMPDSCVPPARGGIWRVLRCAPRPAVTGQAITSPGPGPCVPPRRPTTGTSVTPLVPLARSLGAWLVLPSPSRWLLQTIRLRYAIQFTRRSPQVQGHPVHFSQSHRCPCLACGNHSPAGEGCDRAGPSSRYGFGFFSPYFIVPKKSSGLRPILDLRV